MEVDGNGGGRREVRKGKNLNLSSGKAVTSWKCETGVTAGEAEEAWECKEVVAGNTV